MSNDRRRVVLERELRKRDYYYMRKRQTKGEARRAMGANFPRVISKKDLAQAVAACDLDPEVVRSAKERLFGEEYYEKVFGSDDANYYLSRYFILKAIEQQARGAPEAGYAKFFAAHVLWRWARTAIQRRETVFVAAAEDPRSYADVANALGRSATHALNAVMKFFRAERGRGREAQSVYVFFKRRGQYAQFEAFWRGRPDRERAAAEKAIDGLERACGSPRFEIRDPNRHRSARHVMTPNSAPERAPSEADSGSPERRLQAHQRLPADVSPRLTVSHQVKSDCQATTRVGHERVVLVWLHLMLDVSVPGDGRQSA
jgi:hypothetical protein